MPGIHIGIIVVFGLMIAFSLSRLRGAEPGSASEHLVRVNALIGAGFVLTSASSLLLPRHSVLATVATAGAGVSFVIVTVLIVRRRRALRH